MSDYKVIGIDLAKRKLHFAAINLENKVVLKKAMDRKSFFENLSIMFPKSETFVFEACGGAHYMAQRLESMGHKAILLKPKDVKAYAKVRQKNDINDSIAICKASCDPDLMHVKAKTVGEQEISYLHKARQNIIQQRIQRSNALITSLFEFGYLVTCGKSTFAKTCQNFVNLALEEGFINKTIADQMLLDCEEISQLIVREQMLDKEIAARNRCSEKAKILETIPGIGTINASILSIKPVEAYDSAKDFAASLGLVPKQNTTGGKIILGRITKQGDRYARTMLIQGARSLLMRSYKKNMPQGKLSEFIERLKEKGKSFNVMAVAIANKLARITYGCLISNSNYQVL
ncbi:MAG: IS110 family transposase [Rickettsia endosymbiont of Sergentomyia squamirostris]|uniref:IS110 family transposase n=1 Tax=Candidatus Tisiphia endosymbiont of Sergentomyia squamirostris TaxID=3113639 RepID=A0AAT9G7N9_9RICK